MNNYLYLTDTAFFNTYNLKGIVLIVNLLMDAKEVALYLKQESGKRICITLHIRELIVVHIQNLAEVGKQSLALEDVRIIVQLCVSLVFFIVFVVYLAYNLLKDILKRNKTTRTTKLIHNDGDMHLVLLEFSHKIVKVVGLERCGSKSLM